MYELNELVNDLENISKKIKEEKTAVIDAEEEFKQKEAFMWLNVDWETTLEKSRPTEKDKTFYITMDNGIKENKRKMKEHQANLNFLEKQFDIKLSLLKKIDGDANGL